MRAFHDQPLARNVSTFRCQRNILSKGPPVNTGHSQLAIIPSLTECKRICSNTDGCAAIVYNRYKQCHLKGIHISLEQARGWAKDDMAHGTISCVHRHRSRQKAIAALMGHGKGERGKPTADWMTRRVTRTRWT